MIAAERVIPSPGYDETGRRAMNVRLYNTQR
jgi:hypothetical protein